MPSVITWKTELALGSSPVGLLANQVYTDVSQWTREDIGATLTRGRADEHAEFGPASFGITFDNTDGRFTPGNPSSPYVNTLDIGTMIRRTVTIDGTPYVRFTGYIEEIDIPEWANSPFEKIATISATDRLGRIGHERAGTMLAILDYETLSSGPSHYWALAEEPGASFASALSTVEAEPLLPVINAGKMEFGGGDGPPTDVTKAPTFEAPLATDDSLLGMSGYLKGEIRTPLAYGGTNRISMSVWARPTHVWTSATPPRAIKLDAWSAGTITFYAQIFIDMTTRKWTGALSNGAGTTIATVSGPVAPEGKLSHLALVCDQGQTLKLYVDGVAFAGTTCPTFTANFTTVTVGGPFTGDISSVAVWRSAITAATVSKIYTAGAVGVARMNTSDAMTLLAGYAGIPAAEIVSTPRGTTSVSNIPTYGRSRAEVLRDVNKVEGGVLFVDGAGVFQFQTRAKRWGAGAAAFTLPTGDIIDTFHVAYNDAFIINEARAKRTDGSTSRYVDAASQTKRGIYAMEIEARFLGDSEPASRARYLVQTYKDPKPRLGALPVRVTTSLAAQTLTGLTIGDLIAVSGLSADAPTLGNQWVEGISETQTADDYTLTIVTSPVFASTSSPVYFRVGTGTASRVGATAIIAP